MRYHVIACQVFQRELSYYLAKSKNSISVTWLPQGLHEVPATLHSKITDAINQVVGELASGTRKFKPDAFLLCYGLCSNGVLGIESGEIPIVVPRTDDCIGIFLGSQERYLRLFETKSGTYWLNGGWVETSYLPSKTAVEARKLEYIEKYGEDNADFLIEQEISYMKNYKYCGYITSPVFETGESFITAKSFSEEWNFNFFQTDGDGGIIERLVNGIWGGDEFLVCPANHRIEAAYDGTKFQAVPL